MVAPPATPANLVGKINAAATASLRRPDVAESLRALTLEPMIGSPAAAAGFLAAETRLWGQMIAAARIGPE